MGPSGRCILAFHRTFRWLRSRSRRGGGNELTLACDLRYASREHALFNQPEVGTGILPGGGGSERLPRLIGRDRALEAILSSEDYAEYVDSLAWPGFRARLPTFAKRIAEHGLDDVERRLGDYIGIGDQQG